MLVALSLWAVGPGNAQAIARPSVSTETIIIIRHGEKTAHERGQLSFRGLNRSLALPDVLIGKFGKPDYIFAADPAAQMEAADGTGYSYLRPLATIEPTAIRLGMPVNTQIGFSDVEQLQTELTKPVYAKSLIFIAWEHFSEIRLTKNLIQAHGKGASSVPDWPISDFDSIFVIKLIHSGKSIKATLTLDHEGLNDKLSDTYPVLRSTAGMGKAL